MIRNLNRLRAHSARNFGDSVLLVEVTSGKKTQFQSSRLLCCDSRFFKHRRNFSTNMSVVKLTDYDCIGFDLDNTLLRYNIENMVVLEYKTLAKFLVEKRGYNPKNLYKPLDDKALDFMQKGLMIDFARGNVIRIAPDGRILRASHGTRVLSTEEIKNAYPGQKWAVTDAMCKDMLVAWNGPLSEEVRTLLDYFDMPSSLIFARIVDTLDEQNGGAPLGGNYNIWPDVLAGLVDMFDRENFEKNLGDYFPRLKENPQAYLRRCSPGVISWLKEIKKERLSFLITGSDSDFANFTSSYAFGENWRELFDLTVCYAKKPGFFTGSRPFLELSEHVEGRAVAGAELQRGGIYSQGNWKELQEFFSRATGKREAKCIYVGDNLLQDIYAPKVHAKCDTIAIVEEQLSEGMEDWREKHGDEKIVNSKVWGSFFRLEDSEGSVDSLWNHVIKKYAKICVPTVDAIACKSLDEAIECFDGSNEFGYHPAKPKSVSGA